MAEKTVFQCDGCLDTLEDGWHGSWMRLEVDYGGLLPDSKDILHLCPECNKGLLEQLEGLGIYLPRVRYEEP